MNDRKKTKRFIVYVYFSKGGWLGGYDDGVGGGGGRGWKRIEYEKM